MARAFQSPRDWQAKCVRNIAAMGPFSSDRTIRQYADEIWKVTPTQVHLTPYIQR